MTCFSFLVFSTFFFFFFLEIPNCLFVCFLSFLIYLFIYLFIYGCVGSSFLWEGFPQLRQVGATLHHGARASHHRGLSCCGAQAPDAQTQQLWPTGPVAPRHAGSSQTRARTRIPCIGRQTLNHCATREAPHFSLMSISYSESEDKINCIIIFPSNSKSNICSLFNRTPLLQKYIIDTEFPINPSTCSNCYSCCKFLQIFFYDLNHIAHLYVLIYWVECSLG